jgi:hypothetical protein
MTYQIPTDCLNEIMECLEEDIPTLHSCLLVDRLWCEISVRILWRNVWNFKSLNQIRPLKVTTSILSTLVACLSNESKELLFRNGIFISTPTSKPPLFNYAAFCKVLSINQINYIINSSRVSINLLKDKRNLITNEVIKMFVDQIYSLKRLNYYYDIVFSFTFTYFPVAKYLSELRCSSNLPSEFFYQLSQISQNLQSISIEFYDYVTEELKELISLQNNLKKIALSVYDEKWTDIIPVLTKHSQTITKLQLYSHDNNDLPISFVSSFTNLQEFIISLFDGTDCEKLQYVEFSKLQNLKILSQCPKSEYTMKFLEINGKNLLKFYTGENNRKLNLSIANLCPNLQSLFIVFNNGEIDILKNIFMSCQYLESIKIWCGVKYLNEKEVLETVANHAPKYFYKLKICNMSNSDLSSNDLEIFFKTWKNRKSKKLLIIMFKIKYRNSLIDNVKMKIIEKYENLGVIKFDTVDYEKERFEEEEDFCFYS